MATNGNNDKARARLIALAILRCCCTVTPVARRGKILPCSVTNNFNKLANRLNDYYTLLEEKVEERTKELSKANEQLTKEISRNVETEVAGEDLPWGVAAAAPDASEGE